MQVKWYSFSHYHALQGVRDSWSRRVSLCDVIIQTSSQKDPVLTNHIPCRQLWPSDSLLSLEFMRWGKANQWLMKHWHFRAENLYISEIQESQLIGTGLTRNEKSPNSTPADHDVIAQPNVTEWYQTVDKEHTMTTHDAFRVNCS